MKHSTPELIQKAKERLVLMGATNIQILDGLPTGRGGLRRPVPDLVADFKGKRIAVECGYLTGRDRFGELLAAGFEIIIWLPKLEVFFEDLRGARTLSKYIHESYQDKKAV